MKKHVLIAATLCMTAVMATACGSKNTQTTEATAKENTAQAEAVSETSASALRKPDLSNVDPKMAEGPGAFETEESSEGLQVEEISDEELAKLQSEAVAQLEKTDYKTYAKELIEIVKDKDMEDLAEKIDFPAYISCVKTNGGMVDSKKDFMKLDPAEIFSEELVDAMEKVDPEALEPTNGGIIIGEGTPDIVLGIADGKLAVMGINY